MTRLVDSPAQAIENIHRYQIEIRSSRELARRMTSAHAWYAVESDDGAWLFGPSKFIGYVGLTAETYLTMSARHYEPAEDRLDGRKTEPVLRRWFEPSTRNGDVLRDSLRSFLTECQQHARPNAKARVCVLKKEFVSVLDARSAHSGGDRICIDQAICGGRPHIRGTRVRVSDILSMLAEGASQRQILADYPYLAAEDLKAALAFGAAASEHRIVLAA